MNTSQEAFITPSHAARICVKYSILSLASALLSAFLQGCGEKTIGGGGGGGGGTGFAPILFGGKEATVRQLVKDTRINDRFWDITHFVKEGCTLHVQRSYRTFRNLPKVQGEEYWVLGPELFSLGTELSWEESEMMKVECPGSKPMTVLDAKGHRKANALAGCRWRYTGNDEFLAVLVSQINKKESKVDRGDLFVTLTCSKPSTWGIAYTPTHTLLSYFDKKQEREWPSLPCDIEYDDKNHVNLHTQFIWQKCAMKQALRGLFMNGHPQDLEKFEGTGCVLKRNFDQVQQFEDFEEADEEAWAGGEQVEWKDATNHLITPATKSWVYVDCNEKAGLKFVFTPYYTKVHNSKPVKDSPPFESSPSTCHSRLAIQYVESEEESLIQQVEGDSANMQGIRNFKLHRADDTQTLITSQGKAYWANKTADSSQPVSPVPYSKKIDLAAVHDIMTSHPEVFAHKPSNKVQ